MGLRTIDFSFEHLSRVQQFQCGTSRWAERCSNWIKNAAPFPGVMQSVGKYHTRVWLHFLDVPGDPEEYLVGFSSLGETRWPMPPPDGPIRSVGFVPMLAVASSFQGRPSEGTRYSHAIMDHVIDRAREQGYRELCLFVDADNKRALSFYKRFDFQVLCTKDCGDGIRLHQMLKLLD